MKKHFLIVGAGVAGACTAVHLIKSGANVTIIDNNKNVSSRVAAGIINPIVFRRMTKSWRIDDFLPFLKTFYKEIEEDTSSSFLLTSSRSSSASSCASLSNTSLKSISLPVSILAN